MATFCIILGSLLMCGAIVMMFRPVFSGSLTAYLGLWAFHFSGYIPVTMRDLLLWGVTTLIVIGLDLLQPRESTRSTRGRGYIGGGTVAGMVVGMLLSSAGIIVGAAVGAFLGAMAYSRTPAGRALQFPSGVFMRFLCSRGLPAVVAISQVGLILYYSLILAGY